MTLYLNKIFKLMVFYFENARTNLERLELIEKLVVEKIVFFTDVCIVVIGRHLVLINLRVYNVIQNCIHKTIFQ